MNDVYNPDYAIHPGVYLEEILESRGIKKSEFAAKTGITPKTISQIIAGKTMYSTELALIFERTLGISAGIWISLSEKYQLMQMRKKTRGELLSKNNIEWMKKFPLTEMKTRSILPDTKDKGDLLESLFRFFGVADVNSWNVYQESREALFRKSASFSENEFATSVWLKLARDKAEALQTTDYCKDSFEGALAQAKTLISKNLVSSFPDLRSLCAAAGVALVLIPEFKKTHLSGASWWLTPQKAVIALSLRYKQGDHFWFPFFHEAAHILLHSKKSIFLDTFSDRVLNSELEIEANDYSQNFIIPATRWQKFVSGMVFNESTVTRLADDLNLHPGTIVGRLQREKFLPYTHLRHLLDKLDPNLYDL